MQHFMLGVFAALIIVLGTYAMKIPMDSLINNLEIALGKDDKDTLDKLLKFKINWILPLILVLIIYLVGYWCGAVIG